jgi:hypothetical protein
MEVCVSRASYPGSFTTGKIAGSLTVADKVVGMAKYLPLPGIKPW